MPLESNSLEEIIGDELISESTFVDVCNAFENILLNVNYSRTEGIIYEKLNGIRELINQKISPGNILSLSPLTVSSHNVGSSCSIDEEVENFMTQVFCPFCSKIQENEIALVKHLDNSCEPHRRKEFKEKNHIDYSMYLLLPCNKIRCNVCKKSNPFDIIDLNKHSQDLNHLRAVKAVRNRRKLALALFCCSCEVFINYSYKEIIFHVIMERHVVNSSAMKLMPKFNDRDNVFVFTKGRKFKCAKCNISRDSVNQELCAKFISSHVASHNHGTVESINCCEIYCNVCSVMFTYNDLGHFYSDSHNIKVNNQKLKPCFFCTIQFNSLMTLSNHMDSKCYKLKEIKEKLQQNPHLEKI